MMKHNHTIKIKDQIDNFANDRMKSKTIKSMNAFYRTMNKEITFLNYRRMNERIPLLKYRRIH